MQEKEELIVFDDPAMLTDEELAELDAELATLSDEELEAIMIKPSEVNIIF